MSSEEEAWKESLLTDGPYREAKAWLTEGVGTLGEAYTNHDSANLVNKLYQAGATSVIALDIDIDDEYENSGRLLVELADEHTSRKRVLDQCNYLNCKQGFDPESDTGQRYVLIMLD